MTQCTCPGDPVPWYEDGGADSSRPDTGDASHDTGDTLHTGRDTGPARDAGQPTWIPLPGLSPRCGEMAVDPSAVHPPLQFEPCPGRTGCRQLVLDWEPNRDGARFIVNDDTGYHDGARGIFVFKRPDPALATSASLKAWWTLVATDAGEVLAVFRHTDITSGGCFFGRVVVGEGHFAVEVALGDLSSRLFGGELSAPAATLRHVALFDPAALGTGWISFLRVGAEHMALNTTAYHGFRVGWDGNIQRIERGGIPVDASPPSVVGRAIIFDSWEARNGILVSDAGGPPLDLVPPPAPGAEPSVHSRTDGRTLAWFTGFNRVGGSALFFERVELWASPFAPRAADLRPVRLSAMRNSGVHSSVLGGYGHAAAMDDDAAVIHFFRVADGHQTELRAPAGLKWSGWVSYIGPREVLLSAGTTAAFGGQIAVQFIDFAALEPPP